MDKMIVRNGRPSNRIRFGPADTGDLALFWIQRFPLFTTWSYGDGLHMKFSSTTTCPQADRFERNNTRNFSSVNKNKKIKILAFIIRLFICLILSRFSVEKRVTGLNLLGLVISSLFAGQNFYLDLARWSLVTPYLFLLAVWASKYYVGRSTPAAAHFQ